MRSQALMVARRCATISREQSNLSKARWTSSSDRASRADDGSSRTITEGSQQGPPSTRCRRPPLNKVPAAPAGVSSPWEARRDLIQSAAARLLHSAAARGSSSLNLKRTLSTMEPENSAGSSASTDADPPGEVRLGNVAHVDAVEAHGAGGRACRQQNLVSVDLPLPDAPTSATLARIYLNADAAEHPARCATGRRI